MKHEITQYFPNFCDYDEESKEVYEFETIEELFSTPLCQRWSKDPRFTRFSLSDNHLMAEKKNSKEWYVVGTITYVNKLKDKLPALTMRA